VADTPAHEQGAHHRYIMHYPEHGPREDDPHYKDFEHYRRHTVNSAICAFADEVDDDSDCDGPLELHHAHIEFALTNGVDFARLEHVYPGISNPDDVGAWVESVTNFQWLCRWHHRGHGGVHCAAAADYEASKFVTGLIT